MPSITSTGRAYALARLAVGTVLMVAPGFGGRLLGDPNATRTIRLLGVRDMLLGVEALIAAPGSPSWRRSMVLGAVADAADAAMTAGRLRRREPFSLLVFTSAATAAMTGLLIARSGRPGSGDAAEPTTR